MLVNTSLFNTFFLMCWAYLLAKFTKLYRKLSW